MAKKSSKKSSSKVNDVSKPGETPASSNARPTITGHSPVIKNDPMVAFSSKNASEEPEEESGKSYITRSKAKISPISEDFKTEDEEVEKKDEAESSDSSDQEEAKDTTAPDEKNAPEQAKPADEKTNSVGSDTAAIDALAQTADSKKIESKEKEEQEKHRNYISDLEKSGKYRLPIIEGGHKGSAERVVSWIFLMLLLASLGVYLAIDAGYIDIGFDLPFEFIKN